MRFVGALRHEMDASVEHIGQCVQGEMIAPGAIIAHEPQVIVEGLPPAGSQRES